MEFVDEEKYSTVVAQGLKFVPLVGDRYAVETKDGQRATFKRADLEIKATAKQALIHLDQALLIDAESKLTLKLSQLVIAQLQTLMNAYDNEIDTTVNAYIDNVVSYMNA
ncbi:hypothetical protein [Loigolactobacillus backii]|uniref:Uncharacterized protein n=1 Tax=Loigolactobacillus backii TaxID=375175 RepID=A0A192H000_9LACO|nr:hypothetical protein [Loigolactobacillus backii]ANK60855.1 hypothetical protein AYR52_11700 [Loigolactobacillus backii]ANK61572.1 hypothetical protein AYR53_01620 [Loigolactobacillus backii]ANK65808.1 hypothetical protein AYR54_11490 [Loigolactobacillus backii]ANK68284.1 hypothetical protein AYR55_11640 [Loigolactobacillus backii]ANK69230.1 hypothetical protein AYR56_03095 [Loigolactobacillus backii]